MITKRQKAQLNRLIKAYVEAKVNDSWKGSGDPEEIEPIERKVRETKIRLDRFIETITQDV